MTAAALRTIFRSKDRKLTMEKEPQKGKLGFPPLHLPEDKKPEYSNLARISHTPSEIVLDFAALLPGIRPEIVSRVLMSPIGAKMFHQALAENLARYEASFGEIKIPAATSNLADNLFRNIQPPEKPDKPETPESED
jgi:hypothetical protein